MKLGVFFVSTLALAAAMSTWASDSKSTETWDCSGKDAFISHFKIEFVTISTKAGEAGTILSYKGNPENFNSETKSKMVPPAGSKVEGQNLKTFSVDNQPGHDGQWAEIVLIDANEDFNGSRVKGSSATAIARISDREDCLGEATYRVQYKCTVVKSDKRN